VGYSVIALLWITVEFAGETIFKICEHLADRSEAGRGPVAYLLVRASSLLVS